MDGIFFGLVVGAGQANKPPQEQKILLSFARGQLLSLDVTVLKKIPTLSKFKFLKFFLAQYKWQNQFFKLAVLISSDLFKTSVRLPKTPHVDFQALAKIQN